MLTLRSSILTAIAFVAATLLLASGATDRLELPVRDAVLRRLPERAPRATVIVAIDEASLCAIGPWPWSRGTIATHHCLRSAAARRGFHATRR